MSHADFSMRALVRAHRDCRRRKRNTPAAQAFERDQEVNLFHLAERLADGSYRPGRSFRFVVTHPKPREVWAADYPDRVVHHLLHNKVAARFERTFIADTYACLKGRGTLRGAQRMEAMMRSVTENWSKPAFYLKMDIANFFVSIDKNLLWEMLAERIPEPWWRRLAHTILWHDPRENFLHCGDVRLLELVPPHKRLTSHPADKGLPIGNLPSQFDANVYLNPVDQFAKHRLKLRHYGRYVDDILAAHRSREALVEAHGRVGEFLWARLRLKLNPAKTIIQPVERGPDFVGQVIKPWRRTIRRRTFNIALQRLATMPAAELPTAGASYLGLVHQATHGHHDAARIANVIRDRGFGVDSRFTRVFQPKERP